MAEQDLNTSGGASRLEVGDWVRILPVIRSLPVHTDIKGAPWVDPEMLSMVGRTFRIREIEEAHYAKEAFNVEGWWWIREWLEKVPDAVGVPEPQAKGPSLPEVTQPGEGVDLEAEVERLRKALEDIESWSIPRKRLGAALEHIRGVARVALRRESK